MWGLLSIGLVAVGVPGAIRVQAQTTHAQCVTGFEWSFNTKGQSPCQVSEFLGGVCNGGVFTVPPLGEDQVYRGPDSSAANTCRCSMVFYAMTSTCAACQTRSWVSWSQYSSNCSSVYVGYPQTIPSGTAIPHYAYQNFTSTDKFDITIAQSATGPESVAPSGTGGGSSSTGGSSSGGGSNAGAIAGGVVGGVVGLGIIIGVASWFLRKRNSSPQGTHPVNLSADPLTPPPMTYVGSPGPDYSSATPPPKLYNPSDPSTFPSSPANTTSDAYTTQSNVPYGYAQPPPPQASPQPARPGYYSGAPEV